MTEEKKYSLATLIDLCGGRKEAVKAALPWHDLRDGGLWLTSRDFGVAGIELATLQWHPRRNSALPALPVPFTARDLAALLLAGGGLFLFERFDFEPLDAGMPLTEARRDAARAAHDLFEVALRGLGENADEAREALREAIKLRRVADGKFGRGDDGVREAASWLLHAVALSAPTVPADRHRRPARTTWLVDTGQYVVKLMRASRVTTAKAIYFALEESASSPESPFEKGTGHRRGSLVVRRTGRPISLKTFQNRWGELCALRDANKPG